MEIQEYVANLRREGVLFFAAAEQTPPNAVIPGCPGWRMSDLVLHIGRVQRWATVFVSQARTTPMSPEERAEFFVRQADGGDLLQWFRRGHSDLVQALETAKPDLACWTFVPSPSPLGFWARRQALENAIHRVDMESATGEITPLPADFAVEGLNELLFGLARRTDRNFRFDVPATLCLRASDIDHAWTVETGADGIQAAPGACEATCEVNATASDLFQLLNNRRAYVGLDVAGDVTVLDRWRQIVRI